MFNTNKLILIITFVLMSLPSFGICSINAKREKIKSAFGMKLGEILSHQKNITETKWSFQPTERSKHFNDYYLITTPVSKKVMVISGLSGNLSSSACKKKSEQIMELLKLKYRHTSTNRVPQRFMIGRDITRRYLNDFYVYKRKLYIPKQKGRGDNIELMCVQQSTFKAAKNSNCSEYGHPYNNSLINTFKMDAIINKQHVYSLYKNPNRESLAFKTGTSFDFVYPYYFGNKVYWPSPNKWYMNSRSKQCVENNYKVLIVYQSEDFSPETELKEYFKKRKLQTYNPIADKQSFFCVFIRTFLFKI